MKSLANSLRGHFDTLEERFPIFLQHGVQLEGWFKGELLVACEDLLKQREISQINREVQFETISKRKIDLVLDTATQRHWIELKYWLVGQQKDNKFGPQFYAYDRSSVGIIKDVEKLRCVQDSGSLWLLILNVANPGLEDWTEALRKFRERFGIQIQSHTSPQDFPESYFLGLVKVPRA